MNPLIIKSIIHDAGGASAIAADRQLTQSAVSNWIGREQIPAEHCPSLERLSCGRWRCEQMRPDVEWNVLRGIAAVTSLSPAASSDP